MQIAEVPNMIPAISQELSIPITVSDEGNTVTGRLDVHFLLEGQLSPEQLEQLAPAKIDLVIVLEKAQ